MPVPMASVTVSGRTQQSQTAAAGGGGGGGSAGSPIGMLLLLTKAS